MVVLGVGLRATSKRPSALVALDRDSSIVSMETFGEDDELAQIAQDQKPALISIGAPLGLPLGLDWSEPHVPYKLQVHQPDNTRWGRFLTGCCLQAVAVLWQ